VGLNVVIVLPSEDDDNHSFYALCIWLCKDYLFAL